MLDYNFDYMVRKVTFVFLVVAVLSGAAVAGLSNYSGINPSTAADETDFEPDTTPVEQTPEPTSTKTPTATPTPSPTEASTPTQRQIPDMNSTQIETAIVASLNSEREDRGLGTLTRVDGLDEMAQFHSDNMATTGATAHTVAGYSTEERYERFNYAGQCRISNNERGGIVNYYTLEEFGQTNIEDNTAESLADGMVSSWFYDDDFRQPVELTNAQIVGVGANVTESGTVYITANLC